MQLQAEQQIKPEQAFTAVIDYCWQQRIEIPTHHQLANVITDSFNIVEPSWLDQLEKSLQPNDCEALDALLESNDELPALLADIKSINQSLQPKDIKRSVETCRVFADYFTVFEAAYAELNMHDKATEYYATWVQKATITQFPNPQIEGRQRPKDI